MDEEYNYQPYEEAIAQAGRNPSESAAALKEKGFVRLEFCPGGVLWMKKSEYFNYRRFLTFILFGLPFSIALTAYGYRSGKDFSALDAMATLASFPSVAAEIHFIIPDKRPDVLYYFVHEDPSA